MGKAVRGGGEEREEFILQCSLTVDTAEDLYHVNAYDT